MKTITLQQLRLESFKGIHRFEAALDGQDARICGENGTGKTSLYDGWLWPLFGKDSTGRKDFEVRPLDLNNHPLKGLVVASELMIALSGGETHTLRKEQHEKNVKDQFKGYETLCWVDDVPKKVGEYQEFIDSLIPEETFKMLTDPSYFNAEIHHTERRRMLLILAGAVASPQGFENLLAVLKGRSVKDYEKVLRDEKARYVKERDEIGPRIDEIHRGLNGYMAVDTSALNERRQAIQGTIAELDEQRTRLLSDEKARQRRLDRINHLTVERLHRQSQMRSEGNQTQGLLDEKARIAQTLAEKEEAVNALQRQVRSVEASIESAQADLARIQTNLDGTRKDLDAANKDTSNKTMCYACGQKLPKAKLDENEAKRQATIGRLTHKADQLKETVDALSTEIEQLQQQKQSLSDKSAQAYQDFRTVCDAASERNAEIDALIKNRPEPDYSQDAEYNRLSGEITTLQAQVGESVAVQLESLEQRKNIANEELAKVNAALAAADRARQDTARIAELEAKEKDLSQKIATIDRNLADCADYRAAESRLIEGAVNGLFTHVQFKLFNYNLNGSIEDTCEALLNGVPYADMSTGQQILAGVDVINVLSEHFGISVPLWVDHAESLTLPLEAKGQVIELYATLVWKCHNCGRQYAGEKHPSQCEECAGEVFGLSKGLTIEIAERTVAA